MSDAWKPDPPPAGADEPDPDDEIAEIAGILNAQHGRLIEVVERVLSSEEWAQPGVHSPAQWLAWKAGLSPSRAQDIVRSAERRADFPCVTGGLERGELAVDQAIAAMRAPAWADERVAEFATNLTVAQLRITMTKQFFDEGPDADVSEPPAEQSERLVTSTDDSGRWRISGCGDIDHGAIVDAALAEAKETLFERGQTDATWFDALVEISERSLDAVGSPARRDRFRTWIHIEADSSTVTTTAGTVVPPSIRDRLLCDGIVRPVWEHEGVPFNLGRSQRVVPERTRRIVERRDGCCRVPGCSNRQFVEIHHIIHWTSGGPTDTWNLLSLCGKHHRMHHRGRLGITGNADEAGGAVFTDHLGRVIGGCGRPRIPDGSPAPPETRYEHASGERMDYRYFGGWVHPDVLRARRSRRKG